MMNFARPQDRGGEIAPCPRIDRGRRPPGQIGKVNLERIGETGPVKLPIMRIQRAAEAQFRFLDLLFVPKNLDLLLCA